MAERDNEGWVADLGSAGSRREAALTDLRALLLRGLRGALSSLMRDQHPDFAAYCEDFVQEALVIILRRLGDFEGLSRFTTWAHKITVRVALAELRRARWKDTPLIDAEQLPSAESSTSGVEAEMMTAWVQKIMAEELTPLQNTAITAMTVQGMASDAVAQRMGTTRGALYKLVHDARLKLRKRLIQEGLLTTEPISRRDERVSPLDASRKVEK